MIVIKVGGNELDNEQFLEGLVEVVAALPEYPIIVHGGGRGTSLLMARFGLQARFIDGLRVTDPQTLQLAVMGMVGQASTQLVGALSRAGVPALGLSGVDASLVIAEPVTVEGGELGAVGRPVDVNTGRLLALHEAGFLPCIAPICRDAMGDLLNVNADAVAQSVAAALDADLLVFLTNVPAVRLRDGAASMLTPPQIEAAIERGEIVGGMIPKTRSAIEAIEAGVRRVLITNLEGVRAAARGEAAGTSIVAGQTALFAGAGDEREHPAGNGMA